MLLLENLTCGCVRVDIIPLKCIEARSSWSKWKINESLMLIIDRNMNIVWCLTILSLHAYCITKHSFMSLLITLEVDSSGCKPTKCHYHVPPCNLTSCTNSNPPCRRLLLEIKQNSKILRSLLHITHTTNLHNTKSRSRNHESFQPSHTQQHTTIHATKPSMPTT